MDDAAYFQALPKAELHLHLDGSVRPKTVLELAAQGGVPVPTQDLERLTDYLQATDSTASLVEYITYFELPIAVLQTVVALERATYELCEDLHKDNVRYAEIRYGPWLHVQQGLSLTDVIRAVLSGWKAGRKSFRLEGGVIVTALRDMPPAQNVSLAQVAGRFVGDGVIGFDSSAHRGEFARSLGLDACYDPRSDLARRGQQGHRARHHRFRRAEAHPADGGLRHECRGRCQPAQGRQ